LDSGLDQYLIRELGLLPEVSEAKPWDANEILDFHETLSPYFFNVAAEEDITRYLVWVRALESADGAKVETWQQAAHAQLWHVQHLAPQLCMQYFAESAMGRNHLMDSERFEKEMAYLVAGELYVEASSRTLLGQLLEGARSLQQHEAERLVAWAHKFEQRIMRLQRACDFVPSEGLPPPLEFRL